MPTSTGGARSVALLYADATASRDVTRIEDAIRASHTAARVQTARVGLAALTAFETALPDRALALAASADAVLVAVGEHHAATSAAIVGLREELGFVRRFAESELARMWLTERGTRGCFVVGRLPAGLTAVALALEFVFGDGVAAETLRAQALAEFAVPVPA